MIITKPIGSPNHSIRQPVETLGYDNTRDHETDRLNFLLSGPPSFKFGSYSSTIRDAANATTTARAYQTFSMAAQTTFGTQLGTTLPWSPDWAPKGTNDNERNIEQPKIQQTTVSS